MNILVLEPIIDKYSKKYRPAKFADLNIIPKHNYVAAPDEMIDLFFLRKLYNMKMKMLTFAIFQS
jgi:hypothetical protein